jgi:hypothetical protein
MGMTKQQIVAAAMLLGEIEEKARQAVEILTEPGGDYYTKESAELAGKIEETAQEALGFLKLTAVGALQDGRKGPGYTPGTGKRVGAIAGAEPRRLSRPRVSKVPPPTRSRGR